METIRFAPSDITFTKKLSSSEYSVRFFVHIQGKPYFLKVHRGRGPKEPYESKDRETNIHTCEVAAYKRLQAHGLCDRAVIPKFHGSIEDLDPNLHQPHLDMFLQDEYAPKAILLEYIADMEAIHWTNYTAAKRDNFIRGLEEIHAAGVIHDDVYPRNLMVVKGDAERAIWIDFDRAQTWDEDNLSDRQKGWLDFERELVVELLQDMEADSKTGDMDKTLPWYW
ncbi:hypothetical protein BJY00DRAFT_306542 [Aspergillus carlsbadensis]|nr:hypothetical protein BJY00DRAFT_306542 [Aspergillus carlsbadensis]